ncbi:hypothetical protein ABRP79_16290, partial [Pectobacterium cacticida]
VPSSATTRLVGASGAVMSGAVIVVDDELPAASLTITVSDSPLVGGGVSGTVKLPSSPTSTLPRLLPSASVTVTVLPGSALPLTVVPSPATARSVGTSGAVVSGAVTVVGGEALPAASLTITVIDSPLVGGGLSGTVKLPSSPTSTLPRLLPSPSVTVTVLPGSALPLMAVPSPATARSVGVSGAVVSGAVTVVGGEALPAASLTITVIDSPLVGGGLSGMVKLPSSPTSTLPRLLPPPSVTVTVLPGSALPLMAVPSPATARLVGASGAVVSGAVIVVDDELPAASLTITV